MGPGPMLAAAVLLLLNPVLAAAIPATIPTGLPPQLTGLARTLVRHGFQVKLAPPPVANAYGLYQTKTRTLWVAPLAFELGIGQATFLHEAAHAAQSCPNGSLAPIGWSISMPEVVQHEIEGITYTRYGSNHRLVEREAFAVQGHPHAIALITKAIEKRCPMGKG